MIGVIARDEQRATVEEFFELFKTPWEPYRERGAYDVLLRRILPQRFHPRK